MGSVDALCEFGSGDAVVTETGPVAAAEVVPNICEAALDTALDTTTAALERAFAALSDVVAVEFETWRLTTRGK